MLSTIVREQVFPVKVITKTGNANLKRMGAVLAGLGMTASIGYYTYQQSNGGNKGPQNNKKSRLAKGSALAGSQVVNLAEIPQGKSYSDYQQVYNAIAEKVRDDDDYDGGAGRFGLLTRLAWHNSGTYDKNDNTGGSFGGTMKFEPEKADEANNGLSIGIDFLEEFLEKYPWLSRGDLWTLGGVVAIQECGGPKIKWRPGRKNREDVVSVPPNGRLPDASRDGPHVKSIFSRMGFSERETVALIGAHCLGKCHRENTGYDGPWGPSFNMFTNDFFVRLLQDWHIKKWDGNKQWEDDETNSFMMLPTDMALKKESYFVKYVKMYAEDQELFFNDFSAAFSKLMELGIKFPEDCKPMTFKTLDDQDL